MRPTKLAIVAGIGVAVAMVMASGLALAQDTPPQTSAPVQNDAPAPTAPPQQKAEPAPGDALIKGTGRYSFTRVDGGLLRLDSVSGQVTVCNRHAAGWACQALPEERAALETEIGRLQDEIAGLKAEVAALRTQATSEAQPPRPPADLTPAPDKPDGATAKSPTADRIESARVAIGKAWQRLVDMIVGLKNDVMHKG
jgi:hypothetical protein